jgi:hypothetical protein
MTIEQKIFWFLVIFLAGFITDIFVTAAGNVETNDGNSIESNRNRCLVIVALAWLASIFYTIWKVNQ